MKQTKSIAGVTLLEIMLVLAIASMIIVMSVRYYQNASNASATNSILQQIQSITAAADTIAQGSDYTAVTTDTAALKKLIGVPEANDIRTVLGTTILISAGTAPTAGYKVTIKVLPVAVCESLAIKLKTNPKFTNVLCTGAPKPDLSYEYVSNI